MRLTTVLLTSLLVASCGPPAGPVGPPKSASKETSWFGKQQEKELVAHLRKTDKDGLFAKPSEMEPERGPLKVTVKTTGFTAKRGVAVVHVEEREPANPDAQPACDKTTALRSSEVRVILIHRSSTGPRSWSPGSSWRHYVQADQTMCRNTVEIAERDDLNANGSPELLLEIEIEPAPPEDITNGDVAIDYANYYLLELAPKGIRKLLRLKQETSSSYDPFDQSMCRSEAGSLELGCERSDARTPCTLVVTRTEAVTCHDECSHLDCSNPNELSKEERKECENAGCKCAKADTSVKRYPWSAVKATWPGANLVEESADDQSEDEREETPAPPPAPAPTKPAAAPAAAGGGALRFVSVAAAADTFTPTAVTVARGDLVMIKARGTVTMAGPGGAIKASPWGKAGQITYDPGAAGSPGKAVRALRVGCLVAKAGRGKPFVVGAMYIGDRLKGKLQLGVHRGKAGSIGAFEVEVLVVPRKDRGLITVKKLKLDPNRAKPLDTGVTARVGDVVAIGATARKLMVAGAAAGPWGVKGRKLGLARPSRDPSPGALVASLGGTDRVAVGDALVVNRHRGRIALAVHADKRGRARGAYQALVVHVPAAVITLPELSVGVPACDAYMKTYYTCISSSRKPGESMSAIVRTLRIMATNMRQAAASSAAHASQSRRCKDSEAGLRKQSICRLLK